MSASTSGPRVLTTSLGGSALTRALLGGSGAAWLTPRPVDAAEWRTHAEALRAEMRGRDWLGALTPALSSGTAGVERLRRSAAEQGIVVTTGQQPGLFGGPMYTWTKALAVSADGRSRELRLGSLESKEMVESLGPVESTVAYADGHLFTVRGGHIGGGSLTAHSFDPVRRRPT